MGEAMRQRRAPHARKAGRLAPFPSPAEAEPRRAAAERCSTRPNLGCRAVKRPCAEATSRHARVISRVARRWSCGGRLRRGAPATKSWCRAAKAGSRIDASISLPSSFCFPGTPPNSPSSSPKSKTSLAEKSELTGITIPVKKLKPPMKWNCTVCQVQATSEKNLQMHYAGQKHLSNVATLDTGTKASDQKATTAAEPSLGAEQKKTSIKWSCNTCQATGSCQSGLEAHLKGKRHQQNVSATSMPKNVEAGEAKSHGVNVPKRSEKPPSAWSCSICQAICTSESDLNSHLRGIRHQANVQSLLEGKNMARKEKLNPDSRWACRICQAHCTCESDLENHLAGKRHQLNIQVLSVKTKQEKNNALQMAKNQEPPSEWNCTMCEAKCNSKSQFEDHCRSSRHQQKMEEVLGKGKTLKASSRKAANELLSDCSNRKNANSEKLEKRQIIYFCEQCNLQCNSGKMLVHHRAGKKHREKLNEKK